MIVTWVARRKVAGRRNSLPTLCRLVAGGSAPIARYPWVRGRPQIASGLRLPLACARKYGVGRLNDFSTLAMVSKILVYSLSARRARKKALNCSFGTWIFSLRVVAMMSYLAALVSLVPGGGTWVFFGWVCAARDSKLAPRSKKKFP